MKIISQIITTSKLKNNVTFLTKNVNVLFLYFTNKAIINRLRSLSCKITKKKKLLLITLMQVRGKFGFKKNVAKMKN